MAKAGGQTLFAMFLSLVMAKYCVVGSQQLTSKGNLDLPRAAIRTILDTFDKKKKNICTFFKNLPRIYWRNLYVDYKWTIQSTAGFHRRPKLIWVKTRAKMISRFIDRLVNWNWIQLFLKLKCWKTKQNKKKSWLLHLLSFRDLLFVRNIMKTNTFGGILMT